ncbi:hypothetical protein EOM89_08825 [Candidatus Falkowbacteria bacterium]|nr:hypothetical protein [Candidatus Falkowbacteria bacterium]
MPIDNSDTSKARAAVGRSVPGTALWLLRRLRRGAPRQARLIALMLAAVFAVVLANTFGQVRLNQWQGAFYNALERRNLPDFVAEIGVFFVIVAGLLTLGVAQTWIDATLKVKARAWVTDHVLSAWLQPRRAYLLGFSGEIARNPDQRISQDAARLTDLTIAFTIGLGQASLLLVSFLGVLWTLSAEVVFSWRGESFNIPGYMVWCALAFTLIGSVLTWAVGRPLVARNAETFAREGVFRTELVRISENAKVITLEGGEAGERAQTGRALGHLVVALQMLANARALVHARRILLAAGHTRLWRLMGPICRSISTAQTKRATCVMAHGRCSHHLRQRWPAAALSALFAAAADASAIVSHASTAASFAACASGVSLYCCVPWSSSSCSS